MVLVFLLKFPLNGECFCLSRKSSAVKAEQQGNVQLAHVTSPLVNGNHLAKSKDEQWENMETLMPMMPENAFLDTKVILFLFYSYCYYVVASSPSKTRHYFFMKVNSLHCLSKEAGLSAHHIGHQVPIQTKCIYQHLNHTLLFLGDLSAHPNVSVIASAFITTSRCAFQIPGTLWVTNHSSGFL